MTQKQTEEDLPIDTPSEGDAQAAVDAYRVHCGECVWWASNRPGADKGHCHRYAPTDNTNWATTRRTDFCGDAKLKLDPPTPIQVY